jgi:hypothetical protein
MAIVPIVALAGPAQAATTVALWSMEDPTSMVDSSGNGNTGTTTAITSVPGINGSKGYHFNGTNSVATVPDAPELDPGTANLTITAHVRFTVVPSAAVVDYDLVRKGLSSTPGGEWKMEIYPPSSGTRIGSAYCLFKDAAGKVAFIRGTRNLADGVWHTITCVKTATSIELIVDGMTQTKTVTLGSISNSMPVTVGAKPGGGDQYLGDMDEVSIEIDPTGPGDTTAPTVTARTPAVDANNVGLAANVTATFSENVLGVDPTTFTLKDTVTGNVITAVVSRYNTTNKWILNPTANLTAGTVYLATLTGGPNAIRDAANNPLTTLSWSFTTTAA